MPDVQRGQWSTQALVDQAKLRSIETSQARKDERSWQRSVRIRASRYRIEVTQQQGGDRLGAQRVTQHRLGFAGHAAILRYLVTIWRADTARVCRPPRPYRSRHVVGTHRLTGRRSFGRWLLPETPEPPIGAAGRPSALVGGNARIRSFCNHPYVGMPGGRDCRPACCSAPHDRGQEAGQGRRPVAGWRGAISRHHVTVGVAEASRWRSGQRARRRTGAGIGGAATMVGPPRYSQRGVRDP